MIFSSTHKAVVYQLRYDVYAAIEAFAQSIPKTGGAGDEHTQSAQETAVMFEDMVKRVLHYHLDANLGPQPSQDRLDAMAGSINKTLESINEVADKMLATTDGALRFNDLKACLSKLTQRGGLENPHSSCVINGMSITGVSDIMRSVLKVFGDDVIPPSIVDQATKALSSSFKPVFAGEQEFYDSVKAAIQSVELAVSSDLVAALEDAEQCFRSVASKSNATYLARLKATESCNRDTSRSSVYRDLRGLYITIVNQLVGFLQPNIISEIQQIADSYLKEKLSKNPDDQYFRRAMADTIKSISSSNAGSESTYVEKVADCLDKIIGISDPTSASAKAIELQCLSQPDGPRASVRQIIYGYIQQLYGVLPVEIAARIESSSVAKLNPDDPDYAEKVTALHKEFMKSDPGPTFVNCYEKYVNCLFDTNSGVLTHPQSMSKRICVMDQPCASGTPDGSATPIVPISKRQRLRRGRSTSW
ncbi:hypothetical protein CROQUDRAFT_36652 [Cronartium quercuum f. sp. fusiforme G11]|uniref:Uncharacterized protein n=1 Tax=Cronartium quercuum f. sp. fusiforme G11 TaxID=708437 RepID=A0A9P6TH78_9BASI|nr:hypothetical protein CROQUDRAFT_36652 [Cronartium quercuum f. sp. fusiforme G11]